MTNAHVAKKKEILYNPDFYKKKICMSFTIDVMIAKKLTK